jgi:large subunit ribosomal protein L10
MENPRAEKVAVVTEVRERLTQADAALLTEYRGLDVKAMAELRRALRAAGGDYKIYKNTLVRLGARDAGIDQLDALLTGPTAIAFVDGDAAAVAKALREYAKTNPNLVVKGGLLGQRLLSAGDVAALADLPTREAVLAQLAGALQAPIAQLAGLLAALPRNFAYGLKALIDQQGGVPEPAAEGAAPEAPAAEAPAAEAPAEDAPGDEVDAAPAAAPEAAAPEAAAPEAAAPEAAEPEAASAEAVSDEASETSDPTASETPEQE